MKTKILLLVMFVASAGLYAQVSNSVPFYNWSSTAAYQLSTPPLITGKGYYSDSLSEAHDGITFYEFNNEYYPIETWADYYLWYTAKYSYNWHMPQMYQVYYYSGNDYGMASFVAQNFSGVFYPTRIQVTFPGKEITDNKLGDDRYIAWADKEVKKVNRTHAKVQKSDYSHYSSTDNNAVKRTDDIQGGQTRRPVIVGEGSSGQPAGRSGSGPANKAQSASKK